MPARVLIVDDDRDMCELLCQRLAARGFEARFRTSGDEAFATLLHEEFDVVVTDLNMRGMNGIELCDRIATNRPDLPVVVITAFGSLETAIEALRIGAYDFVTKPFEIDDLAVRLERAIQHRTMREEVKRLRRIVENSERFEGILGESAAMRALSELLVKVAESDASVLISGETGSGKELVARAIHRRSSRGAGPFVPINCAAIPTTLIESELFGHVRGAFTDARSDRVGLLEQANTGTVFLDEVTELPLEVQPKLLRALQERSVRPVGGNRESPFDARLIAATNRDIEAALAGGRLREDLFFRLDVLHVELPPLRARGADVLLLAQQFLDVCAARAGKDVVGLSPAVAEKLLAYSWPGNVRELENCMERAVALTNHQQLVVEDLPERIRAYRRRDVVVAGMDASELAPMEVVERRYILRVLEAVGGNKALAARTLGLDRKTLYRKLELYGGTADPEARRRR